MKPIQNSFLKRTISSFVLSTLTIGQVLPIVPVANVNNHLALEQSANAQTVKNVNSSKAKAAVSIVNKCWNEIYVRKTQVNSYGMRGTDVDRLQTITYGLQVFVTNIYSTHCNNSWEGGQGEEFAVAARDRSVQLFNKYVATPLYSAALKVYQNPDTAKLLVSTWRQAVSVNAYVPATIKAYATDKANLAKADKAYPLVVNMHRANLRLQSSTYKAELKYYEKFANDNGLNELYHAGEALHRDFEARNNTVLFLPTGNLAGMGGLNNPNLRFEVDPIGYFPKDWNKKIDYSARLDKDLKQFKYYTIVPELFEQVNKSILYLESKGLSRLNSFNYLMAELGLDLLLGVTDVPMGKTRSFLSSIPEGELRTAAKKTASPKRASAIVDDIKKGGRSSGSGSVVDDAKNPGRNNNPSDEANKRPSLECVAFNPANEEVEFSTALAKSIGKSKSLIAQVLEESNARVVSDAPVVADSEFANNEFSKQLQLVGTCADAWNEARKFEYGRKSLNNSLEYFNKLDDLKIQAKKIKTGTSGQLSKSFVGEPNSIYATTSDAKNRIVVTDSTGRSILDIDTKRIKIYYDYEIPTTGQVIRKDFKLPDFDANGKPLSTERKPSRELLDLITRVNK